MKRSRPSFADDHFAPESMPETENIEDLASRVLFSTSLEDKLRLTRLDADPVEQPVVTSAKPIQTFEGVTPGRPENLHFASNSTVRPALPKTATLVNEHSRGVLLHFFANHELLAAELMALALLKFPDAPPAFRKGLANTLREEQIHTRWYVNRMRQCGIEFGEYPVNRFFWDAVSTMECPLDYVSRLSLTFEQANLDYSCHYAKLLDQVGDRESSAILDRIYRDEISHVGYGLHWFRQWKNSEESDWSALQVNLAFPLSPSRAKGNRTPFNIEGRRAAGFTDEYIKELSLFERSNGRTPNVFYFNPEAENRIACHPRAYHPNNKIKAIINDLEILPAFLARRDDVLLVRQQPSFEHRERLAEAGFTLPEIESLSEDGELSSSNLLLERKVDQLRPWARSPELNPLFAPLTSHSKAPVWDDGYRPLFSKIEQVRQLGQWMGPSYPVKSGDDLINAATELKSQGWAEGIIKRPFSTAGGGMRRISLDEVNTYKNRDLDESTTTEGGLLLEPSHSRVFDFSVQYSLEKGNLRLLGFIEQIIAPSGRYGGSISFPKFCSNLDPELARFLMSQAAPIYDPASPFTDALREWAVSLGYEGPLGVDAYLHRDHQGELALRVACEVNARYTMGRVALELRRQIAPDKGLKMEILRVADLPQNGAPATLVDGRLAGGSIILNELSADTQYAARITVAKQQSDL